MDAFKKKTLKTSRGVTYTYYTSDGDKSKPTLVFQHGWPDNAHMWKDVAGPLRSTNHPMIIPDLLGYDGTDKPINVEAYTFDLITKDLIDICDQEGAQNIISVGHDWGAACAARLYNYYPKRVVGLCIHNVGYIPPLRQPFDLDTVNAVTTEAFGYPTYDYWHLFTADDGPAVLKQHVERLYVLLHSQGADNMKRFFCTDNALRHELEIGEAKDLVLRPYAQDPAFKKAFIDRMTRDGFEGPQNWYKSFKDNYQHAIEKNLPVENDTVNVPTLYIGATQDSVCRPESMIPAIQAGLLPHLEQSSMIEAAHWTAYEAPGQVVERMEPWLRKHYGERASI